jgi:hypothetical protein
MSQRLLLFLSLLALCRLMPGGPLSVSVSGHFSASDLAGPLVRPNSEFTLSFGVDSNPAPLPDSVTTLGFDVPIYGFSYLLDGTPVTSLPSEIRFNTLANGGLFDITFGSGLSAAMFSFEGPQAFTGTVSSPVVLTGNYTLISWTFSDPANFDSQSPLNSAASIAPAPEPSSLMLIASASLLAFIGLARRLRTARVIESHKDIN